MSEIQIGDVVTADNWGGTEVVRNIITDKDGLRFAIFDQGFWHIPGLRKVATDVE